MPAEPIGPSHLSISGFLTRPLPPESQRFPSDLRLLAKADFEAVLACGWKQRRSLFLTMARPNGLAYARLGLAIPRRQIRRAVDRNRVKRLVREVFRRHHRQFAGLDLVVFGRAGLQQRSFAQLADELCRTWIHFTREAPPPHCTPFTPPALSR